MLSEALKRDLKVTVDDLKSYLSSVRENADRQNDQFAAVIQHRAQLTEQMKEIAPLSELANRQQAEISSLRQVTVRLVAVHLQLGLMSCMSTEHLAMTIHSFSALTLLVG